MFRKTEEKIKEFLYLETGFHIAGNREIIIENCNRIEECSDIMMSFVSDNLLVQIWGDNLRAFDYKTHGLVVRGKISQIELTERRGKNEKSDSGEYKNQCEGEKSL